VDIDLVYTPLKSRVFDRTADALATTLNASKPPEAELILDCKHCDVFEECIGKGSKNHIFHLPRLLVKLFTGLDEKGIHKIEDIPSNIKLTEAQSSPLSSTANGMAM
jgi:hypothetical protein